MFGEEETGALVIRFCPSEALTHEHGGPNNGKPRRLAQAGPIANFGREGPVSSVGALFSSLCHLPQAQPPVPQAR